MPHVMWDLSSLTRDQIHTRCTEVQSLNHWTSREALCFVEKKKKIHHPMEGKWIPKMKITVCNLICSQVWPSG